MNRLLRVLKHRWLDEIDARRALDDAALARLGERVRQSETRHSGEIRLCVEAGLPLSYLWRGAPARERAIAMFGKLRVWDTEHNNGVLIYLLLAEHAIELVADRGVMRVVEPTAWHEAVAHLGAAWHDGRFEEGLTQALEEVSAMLVTHFPNSGERQGPAPHQLPDEPVLR